MDPYRTAEARPAEVPKRATLWEVWDAASMWLQDKCPPEVDGVALAWLVMVASLCVASFWLGVLVAG